MYLRIGEHVSRYPYFWIVAWVLFAALAIFKAPKSYEVSQDGELAFLPADSMSRRAEVMFRKSFPAAEQEPGKDQEAGTSVQQDPLGSNIVIVLEHDPNGNKALTEKDHEFIDKVLLPKLENIRQTTPRGYIQQFGEEARPVPKKEQVISSISTDADPRIGILLRSDDEKATLVILELGTEFLDRKNGLVLARIEDLLKSPQITDAQPPGLSISLSGSATVGRDMLRAEHISASRTETFTKLLVIVLLLLIYRAPLLALVPLVTVGMAVALTQHLLRIMAGLHWIGLFTGLDVYVTVVVYGAGIDYCLFLIARYKEELDHGVPHPAAISRSVQLVGAALATSAGTSIVGIGMMMFSEFGKFREAGFAISFGLFLVLCFALTFTPAFLLVFGRWAFWPEVRRDEVGHASGWLPSTSLWKKLQEQRLLDRFWEVIADLIKRRPATVFLTSIALMMPFAVIGAIYQEDLSYGLLTDLPQDEPSVVGAKAVQKHFPPGVTGPVTLLVRFNEQALKKLYGKSLINPGTAERLSASMSDSLLHPQVQPVKNAEDQQSIGIVDVRSQKNPLGTSEKAQKYLKGFKVSQLKVKQASAHRTYTSLKGDLAGQVMRLDVVMGEDPFSRKAMESLTQLEEAVRRAIPTPDVDSDDNPIPAAQQTELRETASIFPLGTTAGIRDLKSVTDRDRIRIDILVVISVYIVVVLLLRQPEICAYLIVSVVFSFLVTLGMTFVVFYLRDPANFTGIDWKVPVYLFTILIAMGEDYNILLMARVQEEQETRGLVGGTLYALTKTGSIISTCGIIMAGTFFTLMAGTLLGMVQMGFALGFGVLLDTFIVRPILVPAYLILLYSGRFGRIGRFLGAPRESQSSPTRQPPVAVSSLSVSDHDGD